MAQKEDLEPRESACSTAQDYVALAREALSDPVDHEYARHLLEQAETTAQMPPDYVAVAECAVELGDGEYALEVYNQAEEMCFEAMEFAAVGHSLAVNTEQVDKAKELLERAAEEASKPEEYLTISGYARSDLKDEELAAQLLSKVDENAKSLEDYSKLVKSLLDSGESETARNFFKKAERYCSGVEDTLAYAGQIHELFGDEEWARSVLDETESSCQFPKDFAQLAMGYKSIFGDKERIGELMQQAADFAMTGEEQLDLGNGYWELLQDKQAAAEAYRKALPDLNDKQALLTLGSRIGKELEEADLAKTIFTKVEQKSAGPSELRKLAQVVLDSLNDRDYAAEIYLRAAETLDQPNDLTSLAGDLATQIGDKDKATVVYRKALDGMADFGLYLKLLEHVDGNTGDKTFGREILARAAEAASGTPDLLALCDRIMDMLDDAGMCRPHLSSAEEQVTSVGEMKNLLQAVQKHFSDDSEWISQVEEKLALREANQAKYALFQKREQSADNFIKLTQLTDDVMAALDDVHYARKLLDTAEKMMEEQGFDLNRANVLVHAVSRHLQDADWSAKLLGSMAERAKGFGALRSVVRTAIDCLGDEGRKLAVDFYKGVEKQLAQNSDAIGYDFTKLAGAVYQDLADTDWASQLLTAAEGAGGDRFFWAHLGELASQVSDVDRAAGFFSKAAASCTTPQQAEQLISRLLTLKIDRDTVRELYKGIGERMSTPRQQLAWAEGILTLFHDETWAREAFNALAPKMTTDIDKEIFAGSRKFRFGHSLRGHKH